MVSDRVKNALQHILDNQKKRLYELNFYDTLMLVGRLGQVYVGWEMIDWGVKMYDAGQSLPIADIDPRFMSLFIIVLLAVVFMTH
jgi:hypothetical protein